MIFLYMLSLIGSVRILESQPSPQVLLALLGAFLLAADQARIRMTLSFVVIVAGFSIIGGGTASLVALCVLFVTGAIAARPVVERGDLDTALYLSGVILGVLSLWVHITRTGEIHWLILLTVAFGWVFASRFSRAIPSGAQVRTSLIIPAAIMCIIIVFPAISPTDPDTGHMSLRGERPRPDEDESIGRIEALQKKTAADPWNPSVWCELGNEYLNHRHVLNANRAFTNGWKCRPGRTNICLHGLFATSCELGAWRTATDLLLEEYIPAGWITDRGTIPVASELWRRGRASVALDVLEGSDLDETLPREMTGWIAMDTGENNTAKAILVPLGKEMTSGETVFRAAELLRDAGDDRIADSLMVRGATLFRKHLQLAEFIGSSPKDSSLYPVGPGTDGLKLGNAARILGWKIIPDTVCPGESISVITEWSADKPLLEMVVILHVDHGMPTRWRLNADHLPCGGGCPTSSWPVGEVISDTALVRIPADAPKGKMTLFTGLWIPGDPDSRLLPEDTSGYILPRGEQRIPLGSLDVVSGTRSVQNT